MILYTICANCRQAFLRPCAIIGAVGEKDALAQVDEMEQQGVFLFLPRPRSFTARRSSIPEVNAFQTWMTDPAGGIPGGAFDPAWGPRRQKRAEVFYQKLWMGEIDLTDRTIPSE